MKPNIVLIITDALRAKNLSLFDFPIELDKNLKKLASESIFFTNCFSVANATHSSMTSLFAAKFPPNSGIVHTYPNIQKEEYDKLRKNKFWFPISLRNLGYETFYMYTGGMPWLRKGFTYVREKIKTDAYRKINDKLIVRKMLKLLPDFAYFSLKKMFKRDSKKDFQKLQETVDLSMEKIKETKKSNKPFFMYIHFAETHYPWATTASPPIKGNRTARQVMRELKTKFERKYVRRRMYNSSVSSIEQLEGKYNESIKSIDEQIGRLHTFLKDEKLWDKTIFIVISDHGFSIAEHGIFITHAGLYDETIHIPLIMHIPGVKPKKIDSLVQNIDVPPTVLDFLGGKVDAKIDGRSMKNLILRNKSIRDRIYSFEASCKTRWCIRNQKRKIIFSPERVCFGCRAEHGEKIEEYDLQSDPNELKNIYSGDYEVRTFDPKLTFKNIKRIKK